MNTEENYICWKIIDNLPKKMVVDGLIDDDDEGLKVILKDSLDVENPQILKLQFDPYIAYRNMDESYRVKTINKYPNGLKDIFYTVNNSNWLQWFHVESKNIYSDRNIIHYSIFTIADCIDILSEFPPEISWVS